MRLVENLQTALSSFADTKIPVMVDRCQIKCGRNQELEILLNNSSKVKPSPKKLDFSTCVSPSSVATSSVVKTATKDVKLRELDRIDDGVFVNVVANVTSVKPAKPVSTGLVQEVMLTDDNSIEVKLSVWDDNIEKFQEYKSYRFCNILVRSFRNEKALMMTRQSSYELTNSSCSLSKTTRNVDLIKLRKFNIIGIQNFVVHYSCVKCSSKLTDTSALSKCPTCKLLQVLKAAPCTCSMNVYIATEEATKIMLTAYTPIIFDLLACYEEPVELQELELYLLTRCPELQVSYDQETFEIHDVELDSNT